VGEGRLQCFARSLHMAMWADACGLRVPLNCPCIAHIPNYLPAQPPLSPAAQGRACPAYALSPPVHALGSEYMFVGLGCGVVGVHSVATGEQLAYAVPVCSTRGGWHCITY
jgi:hypothetical protein